MAFNAYMHERNIYRNPPDFTQIALDFPEFRTYAIPDAKGQKVHVDFTNLNALRILTKILLKKDFNLDVEIPQGFLIPTVPQRLNYILWIEDLLCNIQKKKEYVSGIDIGTGPCAIFSLLGAQKNGWKFIATESSVDAILWAEKNINKNNLIKNIKVVKVNEGSALNEVLSANNENYDFCLCNPPFFENIEEIRLKHRKTNKTIADGAQKEEIFVKGGELDFVKNILQDSLVSKNRINLFTSMFGKKKSLLQIVEEIQKIKDAKFTTTEFCQGNTMRWGIAWTFNESIHFKEQVKKKIKPIKAKPPLEYQIPLIKSKNDIFKTVVDQTKHFLQLLQILVTETRTSKNFTELLLKSDKNTWSHQRRRRRELERQKKKDQEEKHCSISSREIDPISCSGCNSEENILSSTAENLDPENSTTDLKNIHICNTRQLDEDCKKDRKTVNLENNEVNSSNRLLPESSNSSLLKNNKRSSEFISEDLCMNKKARLEKIIDCRQKNAENVNSDIKNSSNLESISIETNTSSGKCSTTTLPSKSSESNPMELESEEVIHNQNLSSSPICEKVHSEKDYCQPSGENSLNSSENSESTLVPTKSELSGKTENDVAEQGLVLDCHLQFIKGKNKIYIKMNCPVTADRNTMHQVFQLIKNKVN